VGLCKQHIPNYENVVQTLIRSSHGSTKFHDAEFLDDTADIWRKSQMARDLEHLLFTRNGNTIQRATMQTIDLPALEVFLPPADQSCPEDASEQGGTISGSQWFGFEKVEGIRDIIGSKIPRNTSDLIDFYFQQLIAGSQ
jgi:hypothetical protein